MNVEKMRARMDEFFASEEGKKSVREFAEKMERENRVAKRAGEILAGMSYEERVKLIERISAKHDDRWSDLCYRAGYEPYPWNIIYPLFRVAEMDGSDYEGEALDRFDLHFGAYTKEYMGLYFNWIHGQGTVLRIFDGNKREIFHV